MGARPVGENSDAPGAPVGQVMTNGLLQVGVELRLARHGRQIAHARQAGAENLATYWSRVTGVLPSTSPVPYVRVLRICGG